MEELKKMKKIFLMLLNKPQLDLNQKGCMLTFDLDRVVGMQYKIH